MKTIGTLFFLFFFIAKVFPDNQSILFVSDDTNSFSTNNYIRVLEDNKNKLKIDDILKNYSTSFQVMKTEDMNFGMTESIFWLKLKIKNANSHRIKLVLVVPNPDLNFVDFYQTINDSIIKQIHTGQRIKFSQRDIIHRYYVFEITLNPGEVNTIYIRADNEGDSLFIPIRLCNYKYFFESDEEDLIINGFVFGLFIFTIIFNFFLYFTIKQKIYLYYFLYILCISLFLFNLEGLSHQFLWFNSPWWSNRSTIFSPGIGVLFLILFSKQFLVFNKLNRIYNYIANGFIVFGLIFSFMSLLNNTLLVIAIYGQIFIVIISYIFVIIIAFILLKSKNKSVIYFLFAFLITVVSIILFTLNNLTIVSNYYISLHSIKLGLVGEALFLAFAVVDKFRREQKETQLELEKLSIVASRTDNLVMIYDKQGNIEWVNTSLEKIIGYKVDEKEMLDEARRIRNTTFNTFFERCYKFKKTEIFEHDLTNKIGNKIWIQTTLTPILSPIGEIVKIISISHNISKLKETELELTKAKEKAEESDQLKSAFLSNMSHEIRTPISIISGLSDIMIEDPYVDAQKKEYLSYIKNNINKLVRLIDDIIEVSKIESKKINIDITECNINKILKEIHFTINQTKNRKGKEQVALNVSLPKPTENFCILTDAIRFVQVMTNLLDNAIKYTDEGSIEFGYEYPPSVKYTEAPMLKFYVKDTGAGIDKSQHKVIFDRFRQVVNGKKAIQGTGLGLTISKNLVEMLGGEINVESEIGKGSIFTFTIPFVEGTGMFDTGTDISNEIYNINWGNKTILITEDEELYYKCLKTLLAKTQAQIIWAANGMEAVNICAENKNIDIVIMDINMPHMDGYEATTLIKKNRPELIILAHTAFAMDHERDKILTSGFDEYIPKPVNYKQLILIINKFFVGSIL